MSEPYVFITDGNPTPSNLDLASLLGSDTITGATLSAVEPTTSAPLSLTGITVLAGNQGLSFTIVGGNLGTTYGVVLNLTTTALPITVTLAVLVQVNLNVPYQVGNPYAYQSLIDKLTAGEASLGKALFILPPGTDASNGYITWSLLDNQGAIYSRGNCFDYRISPNSLSTVVEAVAVVNAPSSIQPTMEGWSYQLRWELQLPSQRSQYAYENLTIGSGTNVPLGASDTVELCGDLASLQLVIPRVYKNVGIEVYFGNLSVLPFTAVQPAYSVVSGWCYVAEVSTTNFQPDLVPYLVSWKYWDVAGQPVSRESSRLYAITPSVLNAIEDIRQMVMKARTTLYGFDDAIFDVNTIVAWLRRARDLFNAACGMPTSFTMTDATDGVREFWLRYAEVSMMRAQYLAEGEKAFDFQGQAISLNTDKTQYYQQAASDLQQQLDNDIKPFKTNLIKKGLTGGTGNMVNINGIRGATGAVGINYNILSPGVGYGVYSR